jgi:hypothetical protein
MEEQEKPISEASIGSTPKTSDEKLVLPALNKG